MTANNNVISQLIAKRIIGVTTKKLTAISSEFELNTTIAAPVTAKTTPNKSRFLKTSLSIKGANITLETSVVVPNGAIVEAGAKP